MKATLGSTYSLFEETICFSLNGYKAAESIDLKMITDGCERTCILKFNSLNNNAKN